MIPPESESRPNVRMSHEEHGAIGKLTAAVEVLASNQHRTESLLGKFVEATEKRFDALSERDRFSWGKMFSFVGAGLSIAAVVTALLSMRIDNALSPVQTQLQVSINDRAGLHGDVDRIQTRIDAGKDARLAAEKDAAVRLALLEDHEKQRSHR